MHVREWMLSVNRKVGRALLCAPCSRPSGGQRTARPTLVRSFADLHESKLGRLARAFFRAAIVTFSPERDTLSVGIQPTTFHELYSRYAEEVYRFAYWLSGNPEDARDITSETFVRVW